MHDEIEQTQFQQYHEVPREVYQEGESETSIAIALKPYAKHLCIATKGGFKKHGPGDYRPEGHPNKLRRKVERQFDSFAA